MFCFCHEKIQVLWGRGAYTIFRSCFKNIIKTYEYKIKYKEELQMQNKQTKPPPNDIFDYLVA